MTKINNFIDDLIDKSEDRLTNFKIEEINFISNIENEAYIEKPTWLGGDEKFVCVFIDLDRSSKNSFKKHPSTMAKIYDYFTQNIVDIFNYELFNADYIDIKGDGAFAIFEGKNATFRAFYSALTFKTLFEKKIKTKFTDDTNNPLSCKIAIHKDKILVKKIGIRGSYKNEVWAGRLINNTVKLADKTKKILLEQNPGLPIIISKEIYDDFELKKDFGFYACHSEDGSELPSDLKNIEIFTKIEDNGDETLGDCFYYTQTLWCDKCSNNYLEKLNHE